MAFQRNRHFCCNNYWMTIPNTDDFQQKIILSPLVITKSHHEKAEGFCGDPVAVITEMPVASEMPVVSKMFVFLDSHTCHAGSL